MRRACPTALVILVACAPAPKPAPSIDISAPPTPASAPAQVPTDRSAPAVPSASSSAATPPPELPPAPGERQPTEAETRECAARGGKIMPICMMGELACVIQYSDAGKRCTDKRDCRGQCLYEGPDPPPPSKAIGVCERTSDPCGCKALIHDGHVEPTLCAD